MVPKAAAIEFAGTDLLEHPAVRACRRLHPEFAKPDAVENLKAKHESAICRITGIGPNHSSIIAKRCLGETARIERTIYERVLPCLPVSTLRYYGFLEDEDPQFCWLFLEDGGNDPYSPSVPAHVALGSTWLGLLHASAHRVEAVASLPERGPRHYLEHLRQGRDAIRRSLDNPALSTQAVAVFSRITALYDFVESRWPELAGFCRSFPQTVVHGDFAERNIRVRHTPGGLVLLPFDWETAGWGVPAVDLAKCPDLSLYRTVAAQQCPELETENLHRLSQIGIVFRSLAGLWWRCAYFEFEWFEEYLYDFVSFETRMINALHALGMSAALKAQSRNSFEVSP